jgi:hypothetical protein
VTQQIDLRDQPDVVPLTDVDNLLHVILRKGYAIPKLWMGSILIIEIDTQDKRVDMTWSELLGNKPGKSINVGGLRCGNAESANREQAINFLLGKSKR